MWLLSASLNAGLSYRRLVSSNRNTLFPQACSFMSLLIMNFCQIPYSLSSTTQLKLFLSFSSSLHIPINNELHCSLTEYEWRLIIECIIALYYWVTCAFSLVNVNSLRIRDICSNRETNVQILILLLGMHGLGHNIWPLPSEWPP